MRRKSNNLVFKLSKQQKSSLDYNDEERGKTIQRLFEIDKGTSDQSFIETLDLLSTFANVQIKDLNTKQLSVWNSFRAKIDTYYGTESYKRLYEIIRSRFGNIDINKVEIQTPLAYIFGYKISQNDSCSFFYLDSCLLPPPEEIDKSSLKECPVNFVKMSRSGLNQTLTMKPIKVDIPTVVYIVDDNTFEGFNKSVVDTFMSSNIDKVTVYQHSKETRRFNKIVDDKEISSLEIDEGTKETLSLNRERHSSTECYRSSTNIFWPAIITSVVIVVLVALIIFLSRRNKKTV